MASLLCNYSTVGSSTGEAEGEVRSIPTRGILQVCNAQDLHSPRQWQWRSSECSCPDGTCGSDALGAVKQRKCHINVLTFLVTSPFISTDPPSGATRFGCMCWSPPGEALENNISKPLKRFFSPCVLQSHNNVTPVSALIQGSCAETEFFGSIYF